MRRASPSVLAGLAAFALLSLTMRMPVIAVTPVLDDIRSDLGVTTAAAGLLTSIPVLCFAIVTPLSSVLIARIGIDRAVFIGLVAILAGTLLRSSGSLGGVVAGTIVIGSALTVGNIAIPMLIGRDYRHRAVVMTAIYTAAANVGTTAAAALTAPVASSIGWQATLAGWGLFAVLAAIAWVIVHPSWSRGRRPPRAARTEDPSGKSAESDDDSELERTVERTTTASIPIVDVAPAVSRRIARWPLTWLLAVAFAAHNLSFYALSSWLPAFFVQNLGMTPAQAGLGASLFQALGIVGPLAVPVLATALTWGATRLMLAVCLCWVALPLGLLVAPSLWPVWIVLGGMAQGGTFAVISIVIIQRTDDPTENRRLTSIVQTFGYACAATGPVLLGALRDASGEWSLPIAVVLAAVVLMTIVGVAATRTRVRD